MGLGLTVLNTLAFMHFMAAFTGVSKMARSVVLLLLTQARRTLAGNGMNQMVSGLRTLCGQTTSKLTQKSLVISLESNRNQLLNFGLGEMMLQLS